MIRIYLTAQQHFAGDVSLTYDDAGALATLDYSGTVEISDKAKSWIQKYAPLHYDKTFLQVARAQGFIAMEEKVEITFEMFWDAYDQKVNALRCRKRWDRLSKADRAKALAGLRPYFRYLDGTGYQSKKNPENYLLDRIWENYLSPPPAPKTAPVRTGEKTLKDHLDSYAPSNQSPEISNRPTGR